jgi:hypothetical protein
MADLDKALEQFGATAAFAMPNPYGAFASGAISFIAAIFGGGGGPDFAAALKEAVADILDGVKGLIETDNIKHDADSIKAAMDWLQSQTNKVADLRESNLDTALKEILADLEPQVGPGGPVRTALVNLASILTAQSGTINSPEEIAGLHRKMLALQVYSTGVATFLTELRLRLQVTAQLHRDDAVYDHYADFSNEAGRLMAELNGILATFAGRLPQCFTTGHWVQTETRVVGRGFDSWLEDHFTYNNSYTGESADVKNVATRQHPDEPFSPEGEYNRRVADAHTRWNDQVEGFLSPPRKVVSSFGAKLGDWHHKLRPQQAALGPVLENGGSGGRTVEYAISFANEGGEGPRGDYRDKYRLPAGAGESLSHIAIDRLGLAQSRKVYRSTDGGPPELVTIISDNTTTTWNSH